MTKTRFLGPLFLLSLVATAVPLQAGKVLSDLTPAQQEVINSGKQLAVTEEISGKPWPKLMIYEIVDCTPEEFAAVFTDYNNAVGYTPNIIKSEISQHVSGTVKEIDYGVDIPILPDEYYTVRNTLTCPDEGVYRIDWKLVRAVQTKDSVGCLRAEPFDGRTLICYQNLVTPGSAMAGLLRGKAITQMKEAVTALVTRVEKLKKEDPAALAKKVEALRASLGK